MSDASTPRSLDHLKGHPDRVEPAGVVIAVEVETIKEGDTAGPLVPGGLGGRDGE